MFWAKPYLKHRLRYNHTGHDKGPPFPRPSGDLATCNSLPRYPPGGGDHRQGGSQNLPENPSPQKPKRVFIILRSFLIIWGGHAGLRLFRFASKKSFKTGLVFALKTCAFRGEMFKKKRQKFFFLENH